MARYIEFNQEKITRLKREAQQFQDDIVCAVGTDFMEKIAEAENRMIFDILNGLESEPTVDVVSKSEVVKEIFEEIDKLTYRLLNDNHYLAGDIWRDLDESDVKERREYEEYMDCYTDVFVEMLKERGIDPWKDYANSITKGI